MACLSAGDRSDICASLSAVQLVQSAIDSMNNVSLGWASMARALDDKEQHIKLLQESSKLQQLQNQMQNSQS